VKEMKRGRGRETGRPDLPPPPNPTPREMKRGRGMKRV